MNCLPTRHRTSISGFTLVELSVVLLLFGVVSLIGMSLLVTNMKLSAQNAVTNLSNYRSRQAMDHLYAKVRYAMSDPVLITPSGTAVTTGSTADGVLVENFVSGPYIFKNADGTTNPILTTATSFTVEYVAANSIPPPSVGDWFTLESVTRPDLEVASVSTLADSGTVQRRLICTTGTGVGEYLLPANYMVTGYLYRREAYVFSSGTNGNLLHYPRVTNQMLSYSGSSGTYKTGTGWSSASNYVVMGQGFAQLNNNAYITKSSTNSINSFQLRAVARSSNHAEYTENIVAGKSLTTMPVKATFWNISQ